VGQIEAEVGQPHRDGLGGAVYKRGKLVEVLGAFRLHSERRANPDPFLLGGAIVRPPQAATIATIRRAAWPNPHCRTEHYNMSDRFENVTIVKKANVYFDGRVTSRTVLFADGTRKTLGLMMPGEYEFSTGSAEVMEMLSGEADVLLPGQEDWQTFTAGQSFEVPAGSSFRLRLNGVVDYCCSYA
jgi:uncharacterized protein YaiE (UPF0345 family)